MYLKFSFWSLRLGGFNSSFEEWVIFYKLIIVSLTVKNEISRSICCSLPYNMPNIQIYTIPQFEV